MLMANICIIELMIDIIDSGKQVSLEHADWGFISVKLWVPENISALVHLKYWMRDWICIFLQSLVVIVLYAEWIEFRFSIVHGRYRQSGAHTEISILHSALHFNGCVSDDSVDAERCAALRLTHVQGRGLLQRYWKQLLRLPKISVNLSVYNFQHGNVLYWDLVCA